MDNCVVEEGIVSGCGRERGQLVITIYQRLVKLFPPTWQHHRLMNVSTIASIIQQQMSLTLGDQYGKADPRLDASLLQCILHSPASQSRRFAQAAFKR